MFRSLRRHVLPFAAALLISPASSRAQQPAPPQPARKTKPVADWNADDASQLLADSPWVKTVVPQPLRNLSPYERRDSGDWDAGIGKGVGIAGTGLLGPAAAEEAVERARYKPPAPPAIIRWESALPVRVAEQKAGETAVPILRGDDYALAVYGISVPYSWNLANQLRGVAFLRRNKKKDLRPSRVDVVRRIDGTATLVYLFPRSVEITRKDGPVEFVAQIGHLYVSRYFYPDQMQLRGEPELVMPSGVRVP